MYIVALQHAQVDRMPDMFKSFDLLVISEAPSRVKIVFPMESESLVLVSLINQGKNKRKRDKKAVGTY